MRSRISALVAMVALLVSLSVGTVHAAPATSTTTQPKVYHDMSHPMRANYPCPGMAHSGVAKVGQEPHFDCSTKSSSGVQPYANNQSGSCDNGITYLQKFTNVPGYPSTTQVGTFWGNNSAQSSYWGYYALSGAPSSYPDTWEIWSGYENQQVEVEYFWCPSSKYPTNGMNYAYGVQQYSSGCGQIVVANSVILQPGGSHPSPNGQVGDGEFTDKGQICAGNLVWDYSLPGDGTYTWWATTQFLHGSVCTDPGCALGLTGYVNTPYAQ